MFECRSTDADDSNNNSSDEKVDDDDNNCDGDLPTRSMSSWWGLKIK